MPHAAEPDKVLSSVSPDELSLLASLIIPDGEIAKENPQNVATVPVGPGNAAESPVSETESPEAKPQEAGPVAHMHTRERVERSMLSNELPEEFRKKSRRI